MKKYLVLLLALAFLNSCNFLDMLNSRQGGEAPVMDRQPPADHNPVFVLGKQDINDPKNDPRLVISNVDSEDDKLKIYVHFIDSNNVITGAAGMKEIWCEVIDTINGKPKAINNIKVKEVTKENSDPLALSVVMDHSGSMGSARATVVQKAVKDLINMKRPDDKISLIRYDAKVKIEVGLTEDSNYLLGRHLINGLEGYGGMTATTDAIIGAISDLEFAGSEYRKVVLVFADGQDNSSQLGEDEIFEAAGKQNVKVSTIDYGYNVTKGYLERIANRTGGIYHHIYLTDEFNYVFEDLYNRLNNYYVIEMDEPDFGAHNIYMKLCVDGQEYTTNYTFNNVPLPGEITILNVYFDTAKSSIKKSSMGSVTRLLNLMKSDPNMKIEIHGHTDNVGKPESNQKLSEERAASVKKELVSNGISTDRIETFGWGDTKPVASNETVAGKAKNRRTEFVIK